MAKPAGFGPRGVMPGSGTRSLDRPGCRSSGDPRVSAAIGIRTVSIVPSPVDRTLSVPPRRRVRARMLRMPVPGCRSMAAGSKPIPLSLTTSSSPRASLRRTTSARLALLCFSTLVSASCKVLMTSRICEVGR
ncbi:hypothetical protein D3C72_1999830 [compost metagenome]